VAISFFPSIPTIQDMDRRALVVLAMNPGCKHLFLLELDEPFSQPAIPNRSWHLIATQSNIEMPRTAYFVRGSFARVGLKRYRALRCRQPARQV
jgi:hypothetical protein